MTALAEHFAECAISTAGEKRGRTGSGASNGSAHKPLIKRLIGVANILPRIAKVQDALKIGSEVTRSRARPSTSLQRQVKRLLDEEIEEDPYLIACSKLTDAVGHALDSAKYLPPETSQMYSDLCSPVFISVMEKVEANVRGMMP